MWTWITSHFFNPALLAGGAALLAVPVIIHLINRLQYRRVRFAAMDFLLQSQQRNRRRVLLEQLLLLLLRMLAVALIVLLISRLILDPSQLSLFRGVKAHHVVLLDDSASMRDREGERTAFSEAVSIVQKLISEGSRRPGTQTLSVLRLSNPEQPVISQRDVNESLLTEMAARLDPATFRCSHQRLSLLTGLQQAARFLSGERGEVQHLHVISDYRRIDWSEPTALSTVVNELQTAQVSLNLVRVTGQAHENLTLSDFSGATQVAAAGVPLRLQVTVTNHGQSVANDVRLSVTDDGVKLPISLVIERIEPETSETVGFDVRLSSATQHRMQVALSADALVEDNTRFLTVNVADAVPVLVVDGDDAALAQTYITDALAADPESTGITITPGTPDSLRRTPLDPFRAIYLLNVSELPADTIDLLEQYVRAGGGLVWYVGSETLPAQTNETLYREGTGLFPLPLAPAATELARDATSTEVDLVPLDDDLFAILGGDDNPFISAVTVRRFFSPPTAWVRDDQQRGDRVQTLARLRTGAPLILKHAFGAGEVVTVLTSADPSWNDWPINPSYVIFQLELLKSIARPPAQVAPRLAGAPIEFSLDPAKYTEDVEVVVPAPEGPRSVRIQAAPLKPVAANSPTANTPAPPPAESTSPTSSASTRPTTDIRLGVRFAETDEPGIYNVRLTGQGQQVAGQQIEEQLYAINVSPDEGNLPLIETQALRQQLAEFPNVTIQEPGQFEWVEGEEVGAEVRQALIALLILVLLAEQLLAYRLSYHARGDGRAGSSGGRPVLTAPRTRRAGTKAVTATSGTGASR